MLNRYFLSVLILVSLISGVTFAGELSQLQSKVKSLSANIEIMVSSSLVEQQKTAEFASRLEKLELREDMQGKAVNVALETASNTVSYATYLLAVIALVLAVFQMWFQFKLGKDQLKAIEEGTNLVAARLTTPEVLSTIFNTNEFKNFYKKATEEFQKRLLEEQQSTAGIVGKPVTVQDVEEASK